MMNLNKLKNFNYKKNSDFNSTKNESVEYSLLLIQTRWIVYFWFSLLKEYSVDFDILLNLFLQTQAYFLDVFPTFFECLL